MCIRDRVHRDSFGSLWITPQGYIQDTTLNTGSLETKGVDVNGSYKFSLDNVGLKDMGRVKFDWVATYLDSYKVTPLPGGGSYDCAGLYGPTCGTPQAHWKHRVRFTYDPPSFPVSLSLDWRYMGAVKLDANQGNAGATPNGVAVTKVTGNGLLANHPSGLTDTVDEHISGYNWFDISGTWKVRPNLNLRFGVSNILDKDPPRLDSNNLPASGPATGNANTYPGVYDTLGRTVFIGLTADF